MNCVCKNSSQSVKPTNSIEYANLGTQTSTAEDLMKIQETNVVKINFSDYGGHCGFIHDVFLNSKIKSYMYQCVG